MARDTGECSPPNTATAFSRSITSRAAVTPFWGWPSSSRITSSSLRPPSRPPLALTSSMATVSPRLMASPERAEPPEVAATNATLMDGCDCAGARPTPAATHTAAKTRTPIAHFLRAFMTSSFPPHANLCVSLDLPHHAVGVPHRLAGEGAAHEQRHVQRLGDLGLRGTQVEDLLHPMVDSLEAVLRDGHRQGHQLLVLLAEGAVREHGLAELLKARHHLHGPLERAGRQPLPFLRPFLQAFHTHLLIGYRSRVASYGFRGVAFASRPNPQLVAVSIGQRIIGSLGSRGP